MTALDGRRAARTAGALEVDVDLAVAPGETLAVLGPNGAGKTTLLRMASGLAARSTTGTVALDGRVLDDPAAATFVAPEERSIGVVFQDLLLFPALDVTDNVAFGLRAAGHAQGRRPRARAVEWLERFGLGDRGGRPRRRPLGWRGAAGRAGPRAGAGSAGAAARRAALGPRRRRARPRSDATCATTSATTRARASWSPTTRSTPRCSPTAWSCSRTGRITAERSAGRPGGPSPVGVGRRAGRHEPAPRRRPAAPSCALDGGGRAGRRRAARRRPGAGRACARRRWRCTPTPPEGSPRNVWPGTVAEVEGFGERRRVRLDGPVPVVAEVTVDGRRGAWASSPGASVLGEREGDRAARVPGLTRCRTALAELGEGGVGAGLEEQHRPGLVAAEPGGQLDGRRIERAQPPGELDRLPQAHGVVDAQPAGGAARRSGEGDRVLRRCRAR